MDFHNTTQAQTTAPSRTIAFPTEFYIITTSSRSDVIVKEMVPYIGTTAYLYTCDDAGL